VPDNIPEVIEVDVSQMQVKDTVCPSTCFARGITDLGDPRANCCHHHFRSVNAAAEAEAEAAAAEDRYRD